MSRSTCVASPTMSSLTRLPSERACRVVGDGDEGGRWRDGVLRFQQGHCLGAGTRLRGNDKEGAGRDKPRGVQQLAGVPDPRFQDGVPQMAVNRSPSLASENVPQYPWYWSATVLTVLFGLSVCLLNYRVRSLDRLK